MLILCLAPAFFPVTFDGCGRDERGHLQSPGTPTGSKAPTGSHFFLINYATRIYVCFVYTIHCLFHTQARGHK